LLLTPEKTEIDLVLKPKDRKWETLTDETERPKPSNAQCGIPISFFKKKKNSGRASAAAASASELTHAAMQHLTHHESTMLLLLLLSMGHGRWWKSRSRSGGGKRSDEGTGGKAAIAKRLGWFGWQHPLRPKG
jgi:hypothetical protein